jgi:hypothetical protein
MPIEPVSYYIMDKGYTDFSRLYQKITTQNAFFVTRAKDNLSHTVIKNFEVDKNNGVLEDKLISLYGSYTSKKYPDVLHVVTYENFSNGTLYHFMTNDFSLEAITIAELTETAGKLNFSLNGSKDILKSKPFTESARMLSSVKSGLPFAHTLLWQSQKRNLNLRSLSTLSHKL